MMRKMLIPFFCTAVLLLHAASLPAGNVSPIILDAEELKNSMQEHINRVRAAAPARYQEMVARAGDKITNCCSCHVESCQKAAGQGFKE